MALQIGGVRRNVQAGTHGAKGVVLMGDWDAENADDGIANEFLDRATVPLDLRPSHGAVGGEHAIHVLGVRLFRCGGEPNQVAEQRGDDAPLLSRSGGRTLRRSARGRSGTRGFGDRRVAK